MFTRSQAKVDPQAELVKISDSDKPKQAKKKKSSRLVRLTEDLLYIVNKKLRTMDKATRDVKILDFHQLSDVSYDNYLFRPRLPIIPPFTEVVYRKRNFPELSQTELAVMHKANFDSNSTAVCKLKSMSQFLISITRGENEAKSQDFRKFLTLDRDADAPVENPVARFIQLPKDYFRPHSDCPFFAELAWKENGIMMVTADDFALCLIIWDLRAWLVNPIDNSYPLRCAPVRGIGCKCRNLLHAMWTDDRLYKFLEDKAIFQGLDFEEHRDIGLPFEGWEARSDELRMVRAEMKAYAKKLITGQEMISQSNRAENVLSALQMHNLVDKVFSIKLCFDGYMVGEKDYW